MDESTRPAYVEDRGASANGVTHPRSPLRAKAPRPPSLRRARVRRIWSVVTLALGAVIALNLCLLTGFWLSRGLNGAAARPAAGGWVWPTPTALAPAPGPEGASQVAATPEPARGVVTILLLGIDARPNQIGEPTRSDALMVVRADFENKTLRLLSLPRDMWVALPLEERGIREGRINTAYFFGERYKLPGGGPALAAQTVSLNFGIPIDHYAVLDFAGFVRTVDALGGIDVDVPKRIFDDLFPTDDYGVTTLDVPAGRQHMDGLTALRYARTRHQDTDFERVRRQQAVALAVRDKAISLDAVTALPELLAIAGDSLRTDMTPAQMVAYALAAQQIDRSRIETFVIDDTMLMGIRGRDDASLYLPDRAKIARLIEAFLL